MVEDSVRLRREIYRDDVEKMIEWMEDRAVTRYLNEDQNIEDKLRRVLERSTLPIFSPQFNRDGAFFMICKTGSGPIGFLRLASRGSDAEMVIVIGERSEWGKGYAYRAVCKGLRHAFTEWGKERVLATIKRTNERSKRLFRKAGLTKDEDLSTEERFSLHCAEVYA